MLTMNNVSTDRVAIIDNCLPEPSLMNRAAEFLRRDQLVVAPTETCYGLLARADSEAAVLRMASAKRRSTKVPTSIFVRGVQIISEEIVLNRTASLLIENFLPGPLTLIGRARRQWPSGISQDGTLGIRCSSSAVIIGILELTDFPLTATSANISGEGEGEEIDQIVRSFGEVVSFYLDAGRIANPASTIVDCRDEELKLLREGAISSDQIAAVCREADK